MKRNPEYLGRDAKYIPGCNLGPLFTLIERWYKCFISCYPGCIKVKTSNNILIVICTRHLHKGRKLIHHISHFNMRINICSANSISLKIQLNLINIVNGGRQISTNIEIFFYSQGLWIWVLGIVSLFADSLKLLFALHLPKIVKQMSHSVFPLQCFPSADDRIVPSNNCIDKLLSGQSFATCVACSPSI